MAACCAVRPPLARQAGGQPCPPAAPAAAAPRGSPGRSVSGDRVLPVEVWLSKSSRPPPASSSPPRLPGREVPAIVLLSSCHRGLRACGSAFAEVSRGLMKAAVNCCVRGRERASERALFVSAGNLYIIHQGWRVATGGAAFPPPPPIVCCIIQMSNFYLALRCGAFIPPPPRPLPHPRVFWQPPRIAMLLPLPPGMERARRG